MREEPSTNLVEVCGEKFRIIPFDAFDGGYAILFVLRKIIPLLKALDMGIDSLLDLEANDAFENLADLIGPLLDSIDRKELREFMQMCLGQVEILRKAGFMKFYTAGTFNDEKLGHSTKACFILCYHACKPLIDDFFGDGSLAFGKIMSSITNRPAAKTSTNGSTAQ